jgi:excisionase family DNA binding protein
LARCVCAARGQECSATTIGTGELGARVSLLTRAETATQMHVSMSTVRRLGASGAITEVRVGKRAVRVDAESVEEHRRAGRRPAPSQEAA